MSVERGSTVINYPAREDSIIYILMDPETLLILTCLFRKQSGAWRVLDIFSIYESGQNLKRKWQKRKTTEQNIIYLQFYDY